MNLNDKAKRRAGTAALAAYHKAQLAGLLERVRDGFHDYDAGRLDEFGLDELIHHYTEANQLLWSFCSVSGGRVSQQMAILELERQDGNEPDWWDAAEQRLRGGRDEQDGA